MGLSPGKDKKKVNQAEQRTISSIDAVSAPDPLDQRLRAKATKFLDWQDSTDANKNILDAPGISDQMDIYGEAQNLADQELMGSGAGQLAMPSSGAYQDQIKELGKNQRYNTRAAGLSNALQGLKAESLGLADNSIEREMMRRLQSANLNLGNQAQYYNRYKKQNPWYQKLWNAGLQAAQVGAKIYGAM